MSDWEVYGTDFPNVQVTELEITEANKKLRACTYGRGVWEIDMQNQWISNNAGIEEQNADNPFSIYPNPGEGVFNLSSTDNLFINRVLIVSANGMVVSQVSVNANTNAVSFDISGLPGGVYIARVISEQGVSNHRFIKR